MKVINSLREAAQKAAAYRRTVSEIQSMSHDVALDLDIFREDAHMIASQAVYGR